MNRPDPATYWLVGPLVMVLLPHLAFLPPWVDAAALSALLWRLSPVWNKESRQQKLLRLLLALVAVAGVMAEHHTVFGPQGGVSLLVLMTMLKLLESQGRRDHIVMTLAGYFLLLTVLIHDQRLPVAAWLMLCAVVLTASLVATQTSTRPPAMKALKTAGTLLLQGLPLALLLFVLFPRLTSPIGGFIKSDQARTGLSDTMKTGSISQLILSNAVAFRADFGTAKVDGRKLYWRGPVLRDFDGQTWRRAAQDRSHVTATPRGVQLAYTVTLEPTPLPSLPAAGLVEKINLPNAFETSDGEWRLPQPIDQRLRYSVTAWESNILEPELSPGRRAAALALPRGFNPEAVLLGQRWREQYRTPRAIVDAALSHFRDQPYHYSLRPPALGENSVDDFLFGTRRGFCEHYAGAFAVLMRAAGVPARVVTGYQGGEYNALGRYWIIRQRDAHAWDEIWIEGQGWTRVDPTAVIPPDRVEPDTQAAAAEDAPVSITLPSSWLHPLRLGWDYLNNTWNQWVIGYDFERQRRTLSTLSPALASLRGMLWALLAGSAILVAGLALVLLRPFRTRHADQASRLYARFEKKLTKLGLSRSPSEGARSFAQRAIRLHPGGEREITGITELYAGIRYGHAPDEWLAKLRTAVRQFAVK